MKFLAGCRNIRVYFRSHYPETQDGECIGTIIYSGDDVPSFLGCRYAHYKIYFIKDTSEVILSL